MAAGIERNHLVGALGEESRGRLAAIGEVVPLRHKDLVVEAETQIDWVYFPLSGAISMLTIMEDGQSIEAGLVGREGVIGSAVILGRRMMPWRCVVQVPGQALRVAAGALLAEPVLLRALTLPAAEYQAALHWLATLTIACNRFHAVEQRCARWLLMVNDRDDDDNVIVITHEFLSEMLGVRRQSVTDSLLNLERLGLVKRVKQGLIEVVDRGGLEAAACECYERMNRIYPLTPVVEPS